jgi:TadE-like protein
VNRRRRQSGQAVMEFAILYAGVVLPLTFMVIVIAQMLWIWHSVVDFTRDGARYAATHCFMGDGSNVISYMQADVPAMIDQNEFQNGTATIQVLYYSQNPDGTLSAFAGCDATCSAACIPDAVSVGISSYQYLRFSGYFKLPPVTIPAFTTSIPMESAGCDETGTCLP